MVYSQQSYSGRDQSPLRIVTQLRTTELLSVILNVNSPLVGGDCCFHSWQRCALRVKIGQGQLSRTMFRVNIVSQSYLERYRTDCPERIWRRMT